MPPPLPSVCRKCGSKSPPDATYCNHCGNHFLHECWNCQSRLRGNENFCPKCGSNVDGPMAPKAKGSNCPDCQHYRQEVPVSTLLQLNAACDIPSEAMLKIQEEEVKIRDNEAGILASQIAVGRTDWTLQPQMWQYCAEMADNKTYEIVELKNKDSDCMAFRPRDSVRPTQCLKCRYRNRPPDRYFEATARIRDPKLFSDMGQAINKDFELEVMSGWVHRGMLPTQAAFQDWCSWYSEGGRCALCAYMNKYGVCPNYAPLSPEFDIHREKATA